MTEEAEDPGRPTGSRPFAEGDTAGAVTPRRDSPPGSSFSSSLGARESPRADAGQSGFDSSAGADSSAGEPTTESASPTAQIAATASDVGAKLASLSSERPEVVIGAAFVGGLLIASIIKRLAR